jgi:hypothetical protein
MAAFGALVSGGSAVPALNRVVADVAERVSRAHAFAFFKWVASAFNLADAPSRAFWDPSLLPPLDPWGNPYDNVTLRLK